MKLKKDKGIVEYTLSIMLLMIIVLLVLFVYRMRVIKITKENVEDALVSSNLACAVIDLEEFGTTNEIVIKDPQESYEIYKKALKGNMYLDDNFMPVDRKLINGKVTIHEFVVYSVNAGNVQVSRIGSDGIVSIQDYPGGAGIVQTPDGTVVNSSTVYSKIGFEIKSYRENVMYVYKQNSVDVVSTPGG